LRDRRLAALKFRRQVPLGPYIVDFVCFAKRLIIEADGPMHAASLTDGRARCVAQGAGLSSAAVSEPTDHAQPGLGARRDLPLGASRGVDPSSGRFAATFSRKGRRTNQTHSIFRIS
jgi:hypothetical protein